MQLLSHNVDLKLQLFAAKNLWLLWYSIQVTYMYYTGRLEVFNENFPSVSGLNSS